MDRYSKLLVGVVSSIAFALPVTATDFALGQTQTFRQIAVEPAEEKKPAAAESAQPAKAKTESAPADAAKSKPAPEKKAAAVSDDKKPAPADASDAAPEKLSAKDISLTLQTELKRVGCYHGQLDGIWGPRSRSALDAFGHFGKIDLDDFNPSEVWIEHVKGKTKTVCSGNYGYARPYRDYGPGPKPGPGYGGPGPGYDRPPPGGGPRGGYGGGYTRY